MMNSLLNILWIFLLPIILIISKDVYSSITLKDFYVLISTAITHSITYPYVNMSKLNNHRKQVFLVITSLLHLNILCFYIYHTHFYMSYLSLTGLYILYITIPVLINFLHLIKIHKRYKIQHNNTHNIINDQV